nr:MAG TPA: hypothetical protein [Caudoviricetes sp.]
MLRLYELCPCHFLSLTFYIYYTILFGICQVNFL